MTLVVMHHIGDLALLLMVLILYRENRRLKQETETVKPILFAHEQTLVAEWSKDQENGLKKKGLLADHIDLSEVVKEINNADGGTII